MNEIFIKFIADWLVVLIALIGAYLLIFKIPNNNKIEVYKHILLAGLTSYMLAKFAAIVYQPSDLRPFEILGLKPGAAYLDNPGFPSDHALFVTVIALAVIAHIKSKKLSVVLSIAVFLVCVGRVLALVHSPADVIFGVLFGLIGGLWYLNGSKNLRIK